MVGHFLPKVIRIAIKWSQLCYNVKISLKCEGMLQTKLQSWSQQKITTHQVNRARTHGRCGWGHGDGVENSDVAACLLPTFQGVDRRSPGQWRLRERDRWVAGPLPHCSNDRSALFRPQAWRGREEMKHRPHMAPLARLRKRKHSEYCILNLLLLIFFCQNNYPWYILKKKKRQEGKQLQKKKRLAQLL